MEKNSESIKSLKRPKKQFFFPIDKLTSTTSTKLSNKNEAVIKPVDINTLKSNIQPVQEIKKTSPKSKQKKRKHVQVVTDNSDDSFDGIRWKESPENQNNHKGVQLKHSNIQNFSSPLKNLTQSKSSLQDDSSNELLTRYGTDFNNMYLRSPKLLKSCSDLSFSKQTSCPPGLKRTKSNEVENLRPSISDSFHGKLNGWINKLGGEKEGSVAHDEPNQQVSNKECLLQSSPTGNCFNDSIQSSDPFLDDDDELIQILTQNIQLQNDTKKLQILDSEPNNLFSEDPFSDDIDPEVIDSLTVTKAPNGKVFSKSFKNSETDQTERRAFSIKEDEFGPLAYDRDMLRRCKIKSFTEQLYMKTKKQLVLAVQESNGEESKYIVRGEYCELNFKENDILNIILTDKDHPRLIDDTHNLLIWNPDIILSATTIAQQLSCSRKTVITSRYKFPGTTSIPLIVGEMVHLIFQECMITETWSLEFMHEVFDNIIDQYLVSLFSIEKTVEDARVEASKHFEYLNTWFNKYYKKAPNANTMIENWLENNKIGFGVQDILDIEEEIRSPVYGLKGKIDATIIAALKNSKTRGNYLFPMEIKTGREYISHSAQASLYALLFKDRYDMDINSFILVYTKEELTKKCNIRISDLRSLINLRNRVSEHFKSGVSLPDLIRKSDCERCEILSGCMTLNYLVEDGTKENSGIEEDEYSTITAGLSDPKFKEFFKYWDFLIAKEEELMGKSLKQLWNVPSHLRQERGKCFDNLKIIESNEDENSIFYYRNVKSEKTNARQFLYTFAKDQVGPSFNFLSSKFTYNDRVIISDQDGHFAVTTGFVKAISKSQIVISTKRRLTTHDQKLKNFNKKNNQMIESLIHGKPNFRANGEKRFIVDKDEMFYGLGLARFNILNLFLTGSPPKLKNLIVNLKEPQFSSEDSFKYAGTTNFNTCQSNAIKKVFSADDYALILGMPGTGKTTLIVEIIKAIVSQGQTVLISSYTNSAVDNILLKLIDKIAKNDNVKILRVGHPSRVNKALHDYIPDFKEPIKSKTQYVETYSTPNVVATTCLGVADHCFNLRNEFDYCIVDEASQITLPINLGPISLAKKFVLVGDHYQLPPLVLHPNPEVKSGLSRSLFRILSEAHPNALCELTDQYRMCEEIMQVSNVLVYDNKLKCGSQEVAKQSLKIPNPNAMLKISQSEVPEQFKWMDNLIFDETKKVLFLDHDTIPARETVFGESIQNPIEAKLIHQTVKALVTAGIDESQIGVMSFYRSQLELLKRNLSSKTDLEILTADQYQGRDKQCIIISLVRSNEERNPGDLMKEWRRLNVAVTRAKSKLIILGSKSTLTSADITNTFIEFLESKNWLYSLPRNADDIYDIPQSVNNSPIKKKVKSTGTLKSNPMLKNIMDEILN
ncbi:dna2 [Candida pseudojiufengensis]|uniref:dna2 n=1 Tax=Candida pseudojiufengensis TaxID=497109 RepID=UPI002225A072|nr:dna2 [Candida pseudojiufengensis]KAI5962951.1 dna2 [Candida pseudojiufengensis]